MLLNKIKLLKELKELITKKLNLKVEKIILFGSQITQKAKDYSDYDILIVLNQSYDWHDEEKIIETSYDLALKYEIVFDIKLISTDELNSLRGKQPFIQNALKKGIYA